MSPLAGFHRSSHEVLGANELFRLEESLLARIDEVVENLSFGAFCDANELSEFLVFESGETFRDVARRRTRGVAQLFTERKPPRDFWSRRRTHRQEP